MNLRIEAIAGLKCHVVDGLEAGDRPRSIVVLCHGYGAPGTDLVPLGQMFLRSPKMAGAVQFVFPEAPLSLEELGSFDGRAWWPIDLRRLQMAAALGSFREMGKECPPGLAEARAMLLGLVRTWSEKTSVPIDHFVLGGFSQGAMLTTDVTLQLDDNPAGLVILSGTLMNEAVWRERAVHHKTLRVLQSHGDDDPLLPFPTAQSLRELLNNAGADVEFLSFAGGHEIPFEVLNRLGTFLRETIGDGRTAG